MLLPPASLTGTILARMPQLNHRLLIWDGITDYQAGPALWQTHPHPTTLDTPVFAWVHNAVVH